MPLTREDIAKVTGRFAEARRDFERVAGEIHRRCVNLLHGRALRSVVTSRAKSVESLLRSLWRDREKWTAVALEGNLAPPLVDLAGVRVLLYRKSDENPAIEALRGQFPVIKEKDNRSKDKYSAFHLVVQDWCAEDDEIFAALRKLPCEIQVCTIVEHVWNELEHDIVYKQPGGKPDEGQVELLASLRAELRLGAETAERLMSRTDARERENDEPMSGPGDLRRYLEGRTRRRIDGPFEDFWDLLTKLNDRVTPKHVDSLFDQGQSAEAATVICNRFDPDGAHREVGIVAVMLLPALHSQEVRDLAGDNPPSPLWRFLLRVDEVLSGCKT